MLTTIDPGWEMEDGTCYIVDGFEGKAGELAKIYAPTLMSKIKKSDISEEKKVSLKSPNQIFINDSSTMPKLAQKITSVNYIEAPVSNTVIHKRANEDVYEIYKDKVLDSEPTKKYFGRWYLPFTTTLKKGDKLRVVTANGGISDLTIKLKDEEKKEKKKEIGDKS